MAAQSLPYRLTQQSAWEIILKLDDLKEVVRQEAFFPHGGADSKTVTDLEGHVHKHG